MPTILVTTKFYHFRQNNSGGYFRDPAVNLLIEATSTDDANSRAERLGAYFGGAGDCPCCGDRWYSLWRDESGTEEPELYGMSVEDYLNQDKFYWGSRDGIPEVLVSYMSGREIRYGKDSKEDTHAAEFTEVKALEGPKA